MERRGPVLEFDDVVEVDPGDDALIVARVAGESGDAGVVGLLELDLVAPATLGEVASEFSGCLACDAHELDADAGGLDGFHDRASPVDGDRGVAPPVAVVGHDCTSLE